MRTQAKINCDRCGIEISYQPEYILRQRRKHESGFFPLIGNDEYFTIGDYCKSCGLLLTKANISRIGEKEN